MATIVFANGCFDLFHFGHLAFLRWASTLGTQLYVGLNSDASIRQLKGEGRPIIPENHRRAILLELRCVSAVTIFHEETPTRLIRELKPNVLAVGPDHSLQDPQCTVVMRMGGRVEKCPIEPDVRTSRILDMLTPPSEGNSAIIQGRIKQNA